MDGGATKYWTTATESPYIETTGEEGSGLAAARSVKIDVASDGIRVTAALRAQVDRRVLFALSRFGPEVREVDVRVATLNNPLGGFDQQCRMRARLLDGGDVKAEAINGRIGAAVSRAAAGLAVRVAFALDGRFEPKRGSAPE